MPVTAGKIYKGRIFICEDMYGVLDGADALDFFTDAQEFIKADLKLIADKIKIIFDGRNLFKPADLKQLNIEYHSIGRNDCT
jgi:UDPglucose 6-dehydrogenase